MKQFNTLSFLLLLGCNPSVSEANIYNRMQSSASTFNPLARLGIRGGETATRPKLAPTIPNGRSAAAASSVTKKKRRKKKPTAISQPAVPRASAKVQQKPKRMKPATAANSLSPPASKPAPIANNEIPKIVEEKTKPKKEAESQHDKMPSLFTRDEEKQYDTYAACLAATESLRRMRDSKVKNKKGTAVDAEDKSWMAMLKPSSESSGNGENDSTSEEEHKRACAEYVLNSGKAINALGLSVTQFNQLGREVSKNKNLKEKVREN